MAIPTNAKRLVPEWLRIDLIASGAGGKAAALAEADAIAPSFEDASIETLFAPMLEGTLAEWQVRLLFALKDSFMPSDGAWLTVPSPRLRAAILGLAEGFDWGRAHDCDWPLLELLTLKPWNQSPAQLCTWVTRQRWPRLRTFVCDGLRRDALDHLGAPEWIASIVEVVATNADLGDWVARNADGFGRVEALQLQNAGVTDAMLAAMAKMSARLKSLDVSRNPVTVDAVLELVERSDSLERLRLTTTDITAVEAARLAALQMARPRLEVLS